MSNPSALRPWRKPRASGRHRPTHGLLGAGLLCLAACDPPGAGPIPALENGQEVIEPACPSGDGLLDGVLGVLAGISSFLPGDGGLVQNRSCERTTREIAMGTGLGPAPDPAERYGNGGRGELMADGAICLLKALGKAPLRSEAAVPLPLTGGAVSVRQTVGLTRFDPAAKRFEGYHTLRVCLPIAGCFPAVGQDLAAAVRRSTPARPGQLAVSGAPITDAFALELSATRTRYELSVKLPPIPVVTPVGPFSIQPFLRQGTAGTVLMTPLSQPPEAAHWLFERPVNIGRPLVLTDIYGRAPAVVLLGLQGQAGAEAGASSQIALGGRDANPNARLWTASTSPIRPDVFGVDVEATGEELAPRSALEHEPQLNVQIGASVKYPENSINPIQLLPEWLRVFDVEFWVSVSPSVASRLAGQALLSWREGHWRAPLPPDAKAVYPTEVQLQAHSSASISAALDFRVRLKVRRTLPAPFSHITLIDVDKSHRLLSAEGTRYSEVARAHVRSGDRPPAPRKGVSVLLADGSRPAGEPFYAECFQAPEPDQAPALGGHEPGGGTFKLDEFPCNVCAFQPAYQDPQTGEQKPAMSGFLFPKAPASFLCTQQTSGCYDICRYDAAKKMFGEIVRTADAGSCNKLPK